MRALVIGYGNELRGDDGAGPCVARAVAAWRHPGVRALDAHQLLPEMAESLSEASRVVFVDASVEAAKVEVRPVVPAAPASGWGHTSDPGWLLALSLALWGRAPEAWLIAIPVVDLEIGAELSSLARDGVAEALRQVCLLVGEE